MLEGEGGDCKLKRREWGGEEGYGYMKWIKLDQQLVFLTDLSSSDNILIDFIPSLECNHKPSNICYRYVENMLSYLQWSWIVLILRQFREKLYYSICSIVCWFVCWLFNKYCNNMIKQPCVSVTLNQVSGYSHSWPISMPDLAWISCHWPVVMVWGRLKTSLPPPNHHNRSVTW